jgi:hypothetical protein
LPTNLWWIAIAFAPTKKSNRFHRKLGARIPFKKYDVDYDALVYGSEETPFPVNSNHPLYILYTSELLENQRNCKRYWWICRGIEIFHEIHL